MRALRIGLAVVAACASVATPAPAGASRSAELDPGVTATAITIGGTFPLSGPQSAYAVLAQAEQAYFAYANAHGGVEGRTIEFDALDDQFNPAETVTLTQQLVQQDGVFAIYASFGTPNNLAIFNYLNEQQVPQVLISSALSGWGYDVKTHPWTIGFTPDYPGESRIYGRYIRSHFPNAKVAVLYQDSQTGTQYLDGLRAGLGSRAKTMVVSTQPYDSTETNVSQQVLTLMSSGADVVFLDAQSPQVVQALVDVSQDGWRPEATFVSYVGSTDTNMQAAAASGADIDGDISAIFTLDANTPSEADLPGVVLGKQILSQYAPGLDENDRNAFAGWTMVYALRHAGDPPTRAGLMAALRDLRPSQAKDPFLYPGIVLDTSATDGFPISQQQLVRWVGGASGYWQPFGPVVDHAH